MKSMFQIIVMATLTAMAGLASAGPEDIVVGDPWSRASIGTSRPGVAYMTIRNTGDSAMTLTGLRTEVAAMPQVHRTATDDSGVSSMAPAGDIEIAPAGTVALEPGSLHAMLMKLNRPLIEAESYSLILIFGDGSEVAVTVPVLGVGARGPEE
tara:strand:+ start:2170 stop:2628 length:459 start_codon:yes stop_codon:yes gene_type:complete